jgi:DNA-3-methyladenine glycosylase
MPDNERIPRSFFNRNTLEVARQLLGMRLVRIQGGQRLSGVIVETEAYRGQEDLGCHARSGLTARNRVMYGQPGHAYVYFTYGMHWMLNFVTERQDFPAAVLLRAIVPIEGKEIMGARRSGKPERSWTDGPAKLCQALAIDGRCNGIDLCAPQAEIYLEWGLSIPEECVTIGPRVGLNNVPEPWRSIPWRFLARDGQAAA